MDNQVEVFGPLRAFGIERQEIKKGILKIRISLKSNLHLAKLVNYVILIQRILIHFN